MNLLKEGDYRAGLDIYRRAVSPEYLHRRHTKDIEPTAGPMDSGIFGSLSHIYLEEG